MKLVTIDRGNETHAGALVGEAVLNLSLALPHWRPRSAWEILNAGDDGLNVVGTLINDGAFGEECLSKAANTRLAAPLPQPGLILCAGYQSSNFRSAYANDADMPLEPSGNPKPPGCVIGPDAPIVLPAWMPDKVDFEGQFSAVIGRPCNNVSEAEAMDYVAGYTIVNDVSARDDYPDDTPHPQGDAAERVARLGKSLSGFFPMGPVVVTKDEILDPTDLTLITTVNGEVMQEARTDDLVHSIAALLAYFARWFPFRPGDVLTTGSPPGTGIERNPPAYLKEGDIVSVRVDGIGTLSNSVVKAPPN